MLIEKFIRWLAGISLLVHKKASAINSWCNNRNFKIEICSALSRQCAKGLYAAKRSLHSSGIGTKMHFFGNNWKYFRSECGLR